MTNRLTRAMMVLLSITVVIAFGWQPARADTGQNWTGTYFNNRDLQGLPVFTRIDQAVVFNWGPNSPGPGIGSQNWSARWITIQFLNAGRYRFTVTSDDGVRLWINGQNVLDAWREQAPTTYSAVVQVTTGNHAIQVDYFQGLGDARIAVSWDPEYTVSSAWTAQYYNNPDLLGAPVITRYESRIDYFWGNSSPDPAIIPDNFSARWAITQQFNAGVYRFTLAGDDGIRLFIDDLLVINQWRDQALTAYSIDVSLSAGLHTMRVEYYDRVAGAAVRLTYEPAVGPPPYGGNTSTQWYGEYYANPSLAGVPTFVRFDGTSGIRFDWSRAAPAPAFPRENFSARWTRQVCVPGRPYTFYITADDGVRFYIDVTLVLDAWRLQDRTTFRVPVDLTAGCHTFRVEYFQASGNSVMDLTWDPPDAQNPPQYVGGPPPSPTGVTAIVNTSALNLRSGPGVGFDILARLTRNTPLTLSARTVDSTWVRVTTPNAVTGWVSRSFIRLTSGNINTLPAISAGPPPGPGQPTGVRARVLTTLRVRVGPGVQFAQLGTLSWGVIVDVVGRNADSSWVQVRFGSVLGWVYSPYLQIVSGSLLNVPVTG